MMPRSALEIDTTIRRAQEEDAYALGRLAQLDSALYDGGPALVAESGGELVAAVPLGGGRTARSFADPFRHTSGVVALLQLRAAQLEAPTRVRGSRLRRLLRAGRRPHRYRAHA